MKILISNEAQKDLEEIFEYISYDSVIYANETLEKIYVRIYELNKNPYLGKVVLEIKFMQLRELIYKSYRIVYEVQENSKIIYIHFITHVKRNFKSFYKNYIKNNF